MSTVTCVASHVNAPDFSKSFAPCPICGELAPRHRSYLRQLRHPNFEEPLVIPVRVATYCCAKDHERRFFTPACPLAPPRSRYTFDARQTAVNAVHRDHMPFSCVPNRLERDLHFKPAVSTVYEWCQDRSVNALEPMIWGEAARHFSGYLCLDETFTGVFTVISATDPQKDFTIAHWVIDGAPTAHHIETFCLALKAAGISPEFIIHDDSSIYHDVFSKVWPEAREGGCLFHFQHNINRDTRKIISEFRASLPESLPAEVPEPEPPAPAETRFEQLPLPGIKAPRRRGRPRTKSEKPPRKRGRKPSKTSNPQRQEVHAKRFLLLKKSSRLTCTEYIALFVLLAANPFLDVLHKLLQDIYDIFSISNDTPEKARAALQAILNNPAYQADPRLEPLLKRLRDVAKMEQLFAHLEQEHRHRTNNHVERQNRRFKKRQKTHYRLRTRGSIANCLYFELQNQKINK
jgi:hypothetical protein